MNRQFLSQTLRCLADPYTANGRQFYGDLRGGANAPVSISRTEYHGEDFTSHPEEDVLSHSCTVQQSAISSPGVSHTGGELQLTAMTLLLF